MDMGSASKISVVHGASIFRAEVYTVVKYLFIFQKNHMATTQGRGGGAL
jgi:hypothetical protein